MIAKNNKKQSNGPLQEDKVDNENNIHDNTPSILWPYLGPVSVSPALDKNSIIEKVISIIISHNQYAIETSKQYIDSFMLPYDLVVKLFGQYTQHGWSTSHRLSFGSLSSFLYKIEPYPAIGAGSDLHSSSGQSIYLGFIPTTRQVMVSTKPISEHTILPTASTNNILPSNHVVPLSLAQSSLITPFIPRSAPLADTTIQKQKQLPSSSQSSQHRLQQPSSLSSPPPPPPTQSPISPQPNTNKKQTAPSPSVASSSVPSSSSASKPLSSSSVPPPQSSSSHQHRDQSLSSRKKDRGCAPEANTFGLILPLFIIIIVLSLSFLLGYALIHDMITLPILVPGKEYNAIYIAIIQSLESYKHFVSAITQNK